MENNKNYNEIERKFIIDCIKHFYPVSFIAEELGRTPRSIIEYTYRSIGTVQEITETVFTKDLIEAINISNCTIIVWIKTKGLQAYKYSFTTDNGRNGLYYIKMKDFFKFCLEERFGLMKKHFKNFDLPTLKLLNNNEPLPKWLVREVEEAVRLSKVRKVRKFK